MREMKNSGIAWIGRIPDSWNTAKIKQAYSIDLGKMLDSSHEEADWENYLCAANLDWSAVSVAVNKRMFFTPEEKRNLLLVPGDILITEGGDAGVSTVYNGEFAPCYFQNSVLRGRPKEDNNAKFLYYWLYMAYHAGYMNAVCNKATITHYSKDKVKVTPIAIPSVPEQSAIVSYLDKKCAAIDEAIARRQQMNEKLEEYRKAIIYRAVTKGLDSCAEMKDSEVSWIGRMPSSWDLKAAKHCVKIEHGSDPKTEGDVPVYGSGAISFKTCGEFKEGPTVLIGRKGATLHIPHYIEGRFWNVDTAFNVTAKEDYDLEFYYYVATVLDYKYYMTQTTLPSMTQFDYLNMKIPCPPKKEQIRIVCWLSDMCEKIDDVYARNVELIIRLEEYRKSIIYNAVTGKIDCREAV